MKIIVQKFGGTSVATATARARVVERVLEALAGGYRVVVVVSAMGRRGDPYATDTLLDLVRGIGGGLNAREMDLLASCGETISGAIMAQTLRKEGLPAIFLTGGEAGIITDESFTEARIIRVDREPLLKELRQDRVVVVAGFQGRTEDWEQTTLGRGGSDTTAAALGLALRSEMVEIYTDVEGVKTADPRFVPEAQTMEQISYDELFQLATEGARVIHPRAVEMAMRGNIPMRIRSSFAPGPGTLVMGVPDGQLFSETQMRPVVGVTFVTERAWVVVRGAEGVDGLRVFGKLAEVRISVDMISLSQERAAFIIDADQAQRAKETLDNLAVPATVTTGFAKVTVVGTGMRGRPGVMARLVTALTQAGVRIFHTADSYNTISCLVRQEDMEKALKSLHQEFGLNQMREG
ncbi:MAG: aspartate kinase [Firmicutes bacterium]|nr:aspartate kinase [Bacillota bacterium]MCL5040418.1 aspartate kinase [Bacillota bacterium]